MVHIVLGFSVGCLILITGFHAYWAAGGVWPGKDQKSLALIVIGSTDRMPPAPLTWGVTLFFSLLISIPLMYYGILPEWLPKTWLTVGLWGMVVVFGGRGFIGFLENKIHPHVMKTPYARLNVVIYSPLCLLLASCFLYLILI